MTRAAAALALVLLPSLAAGVLGPLYGGRVRLAVPDLPRSLDPARPAGAGERLAAGLVHETLVHLRGETLVPGVAAGWSAAAGGREWRLALSPHARFHDGAPARAADVLRSLRRFLRSGSTAAAVLAERLDGGLAFRAGRTPELPGVAAEGDAAVRLRLAHPTPHALVPLAAAAAAITGAGGEGCGPFAPAVFEPGRRLALAAAADHPAGRPFLDAVALQVGTARPTAGAAERPVRLLLVLDAARPPFADAERRLALAAAIDRAALAGRFLAGALPATGLLRDVAPAPPRVALRPWTGADPIALAVARDVAAPASRRVVAHLAAAGLEVEVTPLSPAAARRATTEARLFLWAPELPEAGLALREAATLARVPPAVERWLRRAEREPDGAVRSEQLDRAHRALLADAAVIPLAALPVAIATPAGLRDARVDASGALRLDGAWLLP